MEIEIKSVNQENSTVVISENGVDRTVEVVEPAKIGYAKPGKAEVSFNEEGDIKYCKNVSFQKPYNYKPQFKQATSQGYVSEKTKVEVLNGVSLDEFKEVYNNFNKKIISTQPLQRGDKYDIIIYYKE